MRFLNNELMTEFFYKNELNLQQVLLIIGSPLGDDTNIFPRKISNKDTLQRFEKGILVDQGVNFGA